MPDIYHRFIVKAPPAEVFRAFASPAGLNSWWTLESWGKPQLNEIYQLYFGPQYDWRAQVTHVVTDRELTWKLNTAMDDWLPTQFGFRLSSEDKHTAVLFFHKDWREASDHFAITTYCWGQLLAGLKNYVEKGIVIPFELRN